MQKEDCEDVSDYATEYGELIFDYKRSDTKIEVSSSDNSMEVIFQNPLFFVDFDMVRRLNHLCFKVLAAPTPDGYYRTIPQKVPVAFVHLKSSIYLGTIITVEEDIMLDATCLWSVQGPIVPILFHLHARAFLLLKHAIFISGFMHIYAVVIPLFKLDVDITIRIRIDADGPNRSLLSVETTDPPGLLVDLVMIVTDISIALESGEFEVNFQSSWAVGSCAPVDKGGYIRSDKGPWQDQEIMKRGDENVLAEYSGPDTDLEGYESKFSNQDDRQVVKSERLCKEVNTSALKRFDSKEARRFTRTIKSIERRPKSDQEVLALYVYDDAKGVVSPHPFTP
ncbi:ACT domain-containing protein ACR11-like protein [Tanacetum coccineum]